MKPVQVQLWEENGSSTARRFLSIGKLIEMFVSWCRREHKLLEKPVRQSGEAATRTDGRDFFLPDPAVLSR